LNRIFESLPLSLASQTSGLPIEVDLDLTSGAATFASDDIALNQGGTFFAPGKTNQQVFVNV
jgi:hypothetical protein